jgi:hypothetical protein
MYKNRGHTDGDIEKQITTMLEKVLSDDDNERMTTMSDGLSGNLNTTLDSLDADVIRQNCQKRTSLFCRKPEVYQTEHFNNNSKDGDTFMGRNNNRRPNTINYGKSEKIFTNSNFSPLLKNKNNNRHAEGVNYIPHDILSLQLRLKLNSDQNPSKNYDNFRFN